MASDKTIKIGTRGSPLALIQTGMVEERLKAAHPGLQTQRVIIKTSGDWRPEDGEARLSEIEGGKGLFAREIEKALLDGAIDCAVHSMKDMPSFLPDGLALDHALERADPCDAFISRKVSSYMDLPQGAVVGTSSLRRQSFVLSKRPDLKIVPLRGNVMTRIEKLDAGQADATFLALAGLMRLGIIGDYIHPLSAEEMVPACGQGIITIETRRDDDETRSILDAIHHFETGLCGHAERAALQVLDGSCHTPIGAHATMTDGRMSLTIVVGSADGQRLYEQKDTADVTSVPEAITLGQKTAKALQPQLPAGILE